MVKIDTYEYESLAKDILDNNVSYNSMIEIFNDKIYWEWFQKTYIESDDKVKNTKVDTNDLENDRLGRRSGGL